jgi:hypothetical protein
LQNGQDERKRQHIVALSGIVHRHPASTPAIKVQASHILAQLAAPPPALPRVFSALAGSMREIEQLVTNLLSPQGDAVDEGELTAQYTGPL